MTQSDHANASVSRELAQEAQSEAPSVDGLDDLQWFIREYSIKAITDSLMKGEVTPNLYKFEAELEAKINRLIVEARIEELEHIEDKPNVRLWFDGFYGVDDRIKELSNNLSKGDIDGKG